MRTDRVPQKKTENEEITKPRPILARFLRYRDVEKIMNRAFKRPKGSKGGVSQEIPYDWLQERKKFDNTIKRAKIEKKKVRWTTRNKLYIDSVLIN